MFRLAVLAVLMLLAVLEYIKKLPKPVFPAVFAGLTLMLCLRCGQGTDYFNYLSIFNNPDSPSVYAEPGHMLFTYIFRWIGLPYEAFIFFYGLIMMALLYIVLTAACTHKFMGLFIFYCMYYLYLYENAIRQGMAVILVLLGLVLAAKHSKVWILLICVALGCMFHLSALVGVMLVIPYFAVKWQRANGLLHKKPLVTILIYVAVCALFIFLSSWQGLWNQMYRLPSFIYGRLAPYISEASFHPFNLVVRICYLAVMVFMYAGSRKRLTETDRVLFYAYMLGFMLYCVLFRADVIAGRIHLFFKCTAIVLAPNMMGEFRLADVPWPKKLFTALGSKKAADAGARALLMAGACVLMCATYLNVTKSEMTTAYYHNVGYIYPYYSVFNRDGLYSARSAPKSKSEDYYAFINKANPFMIGQGPYRSKPFYYGVLSPDELFGENDRNKLDYERYNLVPDPLSKDGIGAFKNMR